MSKESRSPFFDSRISNRAHLAVPDGDLQTRSDERRLEVTDAVVRAFVRVEPVETLRNNLVQRAVHVGADVGVVVLVQGDGCRCVLNKEVQHADLNACDPTQLSVWAERLQVSPRLQKRLLASSGTHLDILEVVAESLYHLVCDQMAAAGRKSGHLSLACAFRCEGVLGA